MTATRWVRYGGLLLLTLVVVASSKTVKAEGMGYSVRAIIPDNQIDTTKTYFDLMVKPGETQQLSLEVTSTSDQPLTLGITPYNGTTNQNGELEFSVEPSKPDSTLTAPITELVSGSQSVTLPPKATKQVTFNLTIPETVFKGKRVGGFTIYDQTNDQETAPTGKQDVQIRNVFSMVIGIQLQEKSETIQPELVLKGVKGDLFNYRTAMTANLQNTQPDFLSPLNVTATIRQAGSKKVLYETEKKGMAMAPNSNFDFPVLLDNQEIKAGKYLMDIVATSGNQTWRYAKKFTISKDEATRLNADALELDRQSRPFIGTLTVVLLISSLVVVSVIVSVTVSNRKGNKKETR